MQIFFKKKMFLSYYTLLAMYVENITEEHTALNLVKVATVFIISYFYLFWWQENISLPDHTYVQTINWAGLWKINKNVLTMFKTAECYFTQATQKHALRIDCKYIVPNLLYNSSILHHLKISKNKSNETIKKIIVFNILEDLLKQYICVRSFFYANNKNKPLKLNFPS